jgi:hypothetical protein
MSDELDRQLRERLPTVDLPEAPASLRDAVERLEAGAVGASGGGDRAVRGRSTWLLPAMAAAVSIVVVAVVVGGSKVDRPRGSPAPSAASSDTTAVEPSSSVAPAGSVDPTHLEATDKGLTLTVDLDRAEVAPGGTVTATATIRNGRATPVIVGADQCGAAVAMTGSVQTPTDPEGRTWDGIAGDFKSFALSNAMGPGGGPAADARVTYARLAAAVCREGSMEQTLAAGASETVDLTWAAEIVAGVPALPGDVQFSIVAGHDPAGQAPSYPPGYRGPLASWFRTWQQLEVKATVRIVGDAPRILSLGEAVDAMLGSRHFRSWLALQPKRTWSGTNVFLQNNGKAAGIVPAGPSWEVDLFREIGVPRNWAIGFVDPTSGKVLSLEICNNPCFR